MHFTDLFNPSHLPIGLDIGAGGVRLLQLRRRGRGLSVAAAARIELPECPSGPGSSEHIAAVVEATKSRCAAGGFVGRRCVVSLEDRMVRVRSVRHPRMPDDELDRAVALDAPGRLGFTDADPAEVGWLRAGEVRQGEDVRDEVILVGARRGSVEELIFGLAGAGLRPVAVEPGFVASARSFARTLRRAADQNIVKVVVDVGLRSTGVTILRGQIIAFHKPLEIGGAAMNKAAADQLGLDPGAIIDLRRQRMTPGALPVDPRVDRAVFEAVRPTIMDLANEVSLCMRYFGVSFRGSRPDSCAVVGGEAFEPKLAEMVGEALHIPTSVGNPLAGIGLEQRALGPCAAMDSPWAVAAGLSMRLARNLLATPEERRRGAEAAAAAAAAERPVAAPVRRAA